MDTISVEVEEEFCEETNFESPCPSPLEGDKVLNMDFLTINGRFTPMSGQASACSTRSVSLATTPIPPEMLGEGEQEEQGEIVINVQPKPSRHLFESSGRTTPVFTWNPLPTGNSIVYAKGKDNEVKFKKVNLDNF